MPRGSRPLSHLDNILATDLQLSVLEYLNANDLENLIFTCDRFRHMLNTEAGVGYRLWRRLMLLSWRDQWHKLEQLEIQWAVRTVHVRVIAVSQTFEFAGVLCLSLVFGRR